LQKIANKKNTGKHPKKGREKETRGKDQSPPQASSPNQVGHKEEREPPNRTLHQCPSKGLLKH